MAFPITERLRSLSQQISKTPQVICQFEGIDLIFGTTPIFEAAKWDNPNIQWDDGVTQWDGLVPKPESRAYISWKGTTRSLSQQVRPDKNSTNSVPTFTLELIDKNSELAQLFSYDNIGEQLGKKVNLFFTFEGGEWPIDVTPLIYGYCDEFEFLPGRIRFSVSHPSNIMRSALFVQYQDSLTAGIDAVTTTIPVNNTNGFIEAGDVVGSYIRIGDELMAVSSVAATSLTVARGSLGTSASTHSSGDEVLSNYTLSGPPVEIALKLLLSSNGNAFTSTDLTLVSVNYVSVSETRDRTFIFDEANVEIFTGMTVGDTIRISGSASNDGDYTVQQLGRLEDGRGFILVQESTVTEPAATGTTELRSKWNVLNEGMGFQPREVDVEGLEELNNFFGAEFIDYENLILDDTIENFKEFIDKQIFFPQNIYPINRKARISAQYTKPPLSVDITPTLNTQNITNAESLKGKRSTHKYLYSSVRYKYSKEIIGDRFLNIQTTVSGDSLNRIPVGNKTLVIESNGLRSTSASSSQIAKLSDRALQRYRFATTQVDKVKVNFEAGFNLETGDVVLFGGEDLQLPNPQTGQRNLPQNLYEIISKSTNIQNGEVTLNLLETGFEILGRLAVFSPASSVVSGATTTTIPIENFTTSEDYIDEVDKWTDFIGAQIRIRSEDYSYDETSILTAVGTFNANSLVVSPALSSAPPAGAYVEFDFYDNQPINDATNVVKLKYTFVMRQAEITSVVDSSNFDIDDASFLYIGQEVSVRAEDYSDDSFTETTTIANIVGNTITLTDALSFTPAIGYKLETYSLSDGTNNGYRFL